MDEQLRWGLLILGWAILAVPVIVFMWISDRGGQAAENRATRVGGAWSFGLIPYFAGWELAWNIPATAVLMVVATGIGWKVIPRLLSWPPSGG